MKIEHLAIWVTNLEEMKGFYEKYFEGQAGERYVNHSKNFTSYFISFETGCRLELMHRPDIPVDASKEIEKRGIVHFAISVGSSEAVDKLTAEIAKNGYTVVGQPRITGDGYYESVILDPEGNRIEITI